MTATSMAMESHLVHLTQIVDTESDLPDTKLGQTTRNTATESHLGHLTQIVAMESAHLVMA